MLSWLNHVKRRTGWSGIPDVNAILAIEAEAEALSAATPTLREAARAVFDSMTRMDSKTATVSAEKLTTLAVVLATTPQPDPEVPA
jgi:hypothetical protein